MTLPADISRCPGASAPLCQSCWRRTEKSAHPMQEWMAPPLWDDGWCGAYIPPKATDAQIAEAAA